MQLNQFNYCYKKAKVLPETYSYLVTPTVLLFKKADKCFILQNKK